MNKQQKHPAHQMKESLDQKVFAIKGHIQTLEHILPQQAEKLTHDYKVLRDHNSGIANNPKFRHLIPGWIVVCFVLWQYTIDLSVLTNIYSRMLEATSLRGFVTNLLVIICPLLLMALYLVISHFYSETYQRYLEEKAAKLQSRNVILEPYPAEVKKPAGLIVAGIAKFIVALFILISALAVMGAAKGDSSTQTGILAITWLAFITHLIFIFFGEYILAAIYAFRAKRFWKKRYQLVMTKKETEGKIAITGEQWLDERGIALNQFPELSQLFRDKFTIADQRVLSRLTTAHFEGIENEVDCPLFPSWPPPFGNEVNVGKDEDKPNDSPGDNLTVPNQPGNGQQPATGENASNENPYVDNINSVQI